LAGVVVQAIWTRRQDGGVPLVGGGVAGLVNLEPDEGAVKRHVGVYGS
jgi:hypothetical protein